MFCLLDHNNSMDELLRIKDNLGDGAYTTSYAHVKCIIKASFIQSDYESLKIILKRMLQ